MTSYAEDERRQAEDEYEADVCDAARSRSYDQLHELHFAMSVLADALQRRARAERTAAPEDTDNKETTP